MIESFEIPTAEAIQAQYGFRLGLIRVVRNSNGTLVQCIAIKIFLFNSLSDFR